MAAMFSSAQSQKSPSHQPHLSLRRFHQSCHAVPESSQLILATSCRSPSRLFTLSTSKFTLIPEHKKSGGLELSRMQAFFHQEQAPRRLRELVMEGVANLRSVCGCALSITSRWAFECFAQTGMDYVFDDGGRSADGCGRRERTVEDRVNGFWVGDERCLQWWGLLDERGVLARTSDRT